VAIIGLAVAVGVSVAWSGWSQHSGARDRSVIEQTIRAAGDSETEWYQHPRTHRLEKMEKYYVRGSAGLGQVVGAVTNFRHEHCRWAPSAYQFVAVEAVDITGATATAETVETYHQPRVCDGPPPPTRAKVDDRAKVTFHLVKHGGKWLISSTTAIYLT
jgi:hypothetical protein